MTTTWSTSLAPTSSGCDIEVIDVIEETALAVAQATIQNAIEDAGLKRIEIARRMGRPRSFLTKMLSGGHNLTIKTFARALAACGFEMRISYVPINMERALLLSRGSNPCTSPAARTPPPLLVPFDYDAANQDSADRDAADCVPVAA